MSNDLTVSKTRRAIGGTKFSSVKKRIVCSIK